jgi:hypothetical protein
MKLPARPTPAELADFHWHRAAPPGAAWLGLLLAACLDTGLTPLPRPSAEQTAQMGRAVSHTFTPETSIAAPGFRKMKIEGPPRHATVTVDAEQPR